MQVQMCEATRAVLKKELWPAIKRRKAMNTFLLIATLAILGFLCFLCFSSPDGFTRTKYRH